MTKRRGDEWISVAAAARRVGRSDRTVRRWIDEGRLIARQMVKPKGWIEVCVRSLDELIEKSLI